MAKLKHLTLPDGNNYDIYGVNVQEISYDDYEALTPTQKNSDIAYCITDTPYEVDDSIYGEASGAIASFSDGSNNPLVKLEADINPIQDLHGYDKPWASGAGNNKFDVDDASAGGFDKSGETFTNNSTDTRATAQIIVQLYNGTTYVKSSEPATGEYPSRCYCNISIDSAVTQLRIKHNGSTRDLVIYLPWTRQGNYTISFLMPQNNPSTVGGLVIKDIMICENNYYTPYLPYTNICPISGRSSVEVNVAGANQWDEEWELGIYSTTDGSPVASNYSIRGKNRISVKPNTQYYFNNQYFRVIFYDSNDDFISYVSGLGAKTTPSNCVYIRFYLGDAYGTTYNNDISINYPSTDTRYHPYNSEGTTTTINLGQTVYGGKLNVTRGEMTVDRAMVDLGNKTWYYKASGSMLSPYFWADITDAKFKGATASTNYDLMCSQYKSTNRSLSDFLNGCITFDGDASSVTQVQIKDDRYTDATTFKTAMNGVQLVYELATPITISLTPTQVSSLLGSNNFWADSGDSDVVYITSDFIYNELRMNDTVIASNSFAYHSIESESATMAGHANTASNAQTVNGHTVNSDVPSNATFTDTTYTFANGTNGFTVTPSGGTAQTVTVTPSITNNVTGSGTSGYLAKFNGANTITNGAQLGSDTTKFLRNDGEWAVPPGAGGGVTGVKGNAESTYRTGNVNLTPANLGLESKSAASGGTDLSLVTTGEKYTWDSKASSDEKVKQTPTSTDADYEILFSESASNLTKTEGARKYSNLKFNPSTGNLQTTKINGVTLTSSPKFTDSKTQLTENTGSWDTRTPAHMNTDAYSICMDSSSIGSGTPQSGIRRCDYSRRIAIHPNNSAISIGCCYSSYSRYLYDAIGFASVAISGGDEEETQYTTSGASGTASISVGTACHANANNTVAIGNHINANGRYEFSFGRYNVSGRSFMPVGGEYDYVSEGSYVETVGNGTADNARSNARTLDWSGNEWLAGGITINNVSDASAAIINAKTDTWTISTNATNNLDTTKYSGTMYFKGSDDTATGLITNFGEYTGAVTTQIGAYNKKTNGDNVSNLFKVVANKDGSATYEVSSPANFRSAIGAAQATSWYEVDHKGGTTAIAIPSGTTEICCVITVGNNTIAWTFTLPYVALSSTSWRYTNAYTSVSDGYIAVNVSTAQVSLNAVYNGTTNVTASSILYLYAR